MKKHRSTCPKIRIKSADKQKSIVEPLVCYDRFALSKRLHAENLKHQPLPDKVDDSIFKNAKITHELDSGHNGLRCKIKWRDETNIPTRKDPYFGPVLGCKKPKTNMDLAICWETPMNPVYEPHKSRHIDGTEGGSGPAIFALIQHTPIPENRESLNIEKNTHDDCMKEENSRNLFECCCECLCKGIESVVVADQSKSREKSRSNLLPRLRIRERRCVACGPKFPEKCPDSRLTRSAVGIALDVEEKKNICKNKFTTSMTMAIPPRPKTPFAKRSFCIDTLAPPFSVTSGHRDTDYPEHWRLMSVYQQSYKNPQKRKTRYY